MFYAIYICQKSKGFLSKLFFLTELGFLQSSSSFTSKHGQSVQSKTEIWNKRWKVRRAKGWMALANVTPHFSIWNYERMKIIYVSCAVKNYLKEDHRSYVRSLCSCEKKAWKKNLGLYGILFATASVTYITAMIFLQIIFPLCWNRSRKPVSHPVFLLSMVCYTAVFSVVTKRSSPQDDTKRAV